MGSATLVKRRGVFWLHGVFWREVEEADEEAAETVMGVDRGMNYLAVARAPDGGTSFHGGGQVHCTCGTAQVKQQKHHYRRVRASLQATHALARSASEGTKGAKRTLKRLSGRERRYQRPVNHGVSKEIYQRPVIVLEELGGIRQRARQRKAQRGDFHSWALPKACQLAQFVEYKAAALSIPVVYVDPRGTSQSCCVCGASGTRHRHDFSCSCGYRDHADRNAAGNIAQRYVDRRQAELAGDGAWSTAPEIASGESRLAGGVIPV
jgi:IS605 OrfB family transposase